MSVHISKSKDSGATQSKIEGGEAEGRVSDDNVQRVLSDILKELKKITFHLYLITDVHIRDSEVL